VSVGILKRWKAGAHGGAAAQIWTRFRSKSSVDSSFASKAKQQYLGKEVDVMHACGHDAPHRDAYGGGRGAGRLKAELPGTLMFIFQPAEEGPSLSNRQ
jgi:amidohydrolase